MQYIPDRGFDESLFSGENFEQFRLDFFTLSLGLQWQQVDRKNNRVAYWSLSFFDFNKPEVSFLDAQAQLRTTSVATAGFRIYEEGPLSVMPEALYTRSYANHVLNVGTVTSYELRPVANQLSGRVDLITKYVIGRSGIIGALFHKENFSVGFSYDFPLFRKNIGNLGSIEFGLELRGLVDPRLKGRMTSKRKSKTPQRKTPAVVQNRTTPKPANPATVKVDSTGEVKARQTPALKENLQHKQDSVLALAEAGKIKHEALGY
jgi:hypothetical protein